MADYNVNMKQWNGTSFDNVLPLAYNSNKLNGKTYAEIVQLINSTVGTGGENCRIEHGKYVGTGVTPTQASPKSLSCGFYPLAYITFYNGYPCLLIRGQTTLYDHWSDSAVVTWNDSGLSWYAPSSRGNTFNDSGKEYNYLFFGYDRI